MVLWCARFTDSREAFESAHVAADRGECGRAYLDADGFSCHGASSPLHHSLHHHLITVHCTTSTPLLHSCCSATTAAAHPILLLSSHHSSVQVIELLAHGNSNRSVAATNLNDTSSSSHAVFQLRIKVVEPDWRIASSPTLVLADLAGSERCTLSRMMLSAWVLGEIVVLGNNDNFESILACAAARASTLSVLRLCWIASTS